VLFVSFDADTTAAASDFTRQRMNYVPAHPDKLLTLHVVAVEAVVTGYWYATITTRVRKHAYGLT